MEIKMLNTELKTKKMKMTMMIQTHHFSLSMWTWGRMSNNVSSFTKVTLQQNSLKNSAKNTI